MNEATDKVPHVVVAIDGSAASEAAVDWAAIEAQSRHEALLIMTACPPIQVPASAQDGLQVAMMSSVFDAARLQSKERHEIVERAADRVRKHHPDLVVTTEVFDGDPRLALELYEHVASVVVLGSRGLGSVRTLFLGSVSFWATRHLEVPTVVVRPPDLERVAPTEGIAVGITGRPDSEGTLREAFAMAARRGVRLTIANASWDSEAPGKGWKEIPEDEVEPSRHRAVADLAQHVAQDYPGVTYALLFGRGAVDHLLAALGGTHDALVLGRHASTALDWFGLGTIASSVVEHAVGATMIIPSEGAPS